MNRAQTHAIVGIWDDLDVACKFVDLDADEVNIEVREEGDDIETLTGEPGWVEVMPWIQGGAPLLLVDPRGKIWREVESESGQMAVVHCKVAIVTRNGWLKISTEDIIDSNGDN